ncbi:MAG TPA: agmatine deiminase family protein [Flavisolibacter sp.]|jgi:agmatine deiminase|nr:agmatine deiminase family protein [Flavisolibacter sp.]
MRKYFTALLVFIGLLSCTTSKKTVGFYYPAQWERQESVWLGWSLDTSIQQVHLQMAKALAPHVGLTILSRSDSLQKVAMHQLQQAGIDTQKVKSYVHYIPNVFIRDAGPRFVRNGNGELAVADFGWNNYGYPAEFEVFQFSDKRGEIDNALAKQMRLKLVSTPMVAEGGGIDASTTMLLSFRETALQRNPGKTLQEIEKEYLRLYGKQKMLWLDRMPVMDKVVAGAKAGNYYNYGANGHIDEFVRFANDSTIVVSMIDSSEKDLDPVSAVDYVIMQENMAILRAARDVHGRPFHIVVLPTPAYSLYTDKEILTEASLNNQTGKAMFKGKKAGDEIRWLSNVGYANFFITNGMVLLASYWQEGLPEGEKRKDEKAREILQSLFPDRKVVQINPMALNRNGGGMNCATQQQPK